jgi:nucleolar MIF4G domain-containing protein 1
LDTSEKTPQIPPKPPQVDKTVPQINTKHPSNNLAPKIDIYGQGTSQPYVPPHLRESQKGNQYSQLKRQIQGLLNKLGNSNIEYVLSQTQQFYQSNKRHDVTEIISDILQSFLVDSSVLNPSFITTYACYISLLHKITTLDFSSHFIQLTITKFTSLVAEQDKSSLCHKCINLIILFGNLYEFAVIGPTLIYDLVRLILKESTPTNVELLVKIFNGTSYLT